MLITLYKSTLCPRCYRLRKQLLELASADPDLEIEEVDILAAPQRSWKSGIRMIPALKINSDILSGLLIKKEELIDFIARHKKSPPRHLNN